MLGAKKYAIDEPCRSNPGKIRAADENTPFMVGHYLMNGYHLSEVKTTLLSVDGAPPMPSKDLLLM
jgi:hypothetical protein